MNDGDPKLFWYLSAGLEPNHGGYGVLRTACVYRYTRIQAGS